MVGKQRWGWLGCDTAAEEREYVADLRLTPEDVTECKSALGKVTHVIHNDLNGVSSKFSVDRVTTCGSVGKGTASSRSSDLDLVVFLKGIDAGSLHRYIDRILDRIEQSLDNQYPGTRDPKWYRKYGLRYVIKGMEIDILVGVSGVQPKDFLDVQEKDVRAYMSASVSHLSTRFMKNQSSFFKDVVRVVKDWRDSYKSWPPQCQPKSYLLEVLLLHTFRRKAKYTDHRKYTTKLLLSFFDRIGNITPYSKGTTYNKDTVSLKVSFDTYYMARDIPWNTPEPLFQERRVTSYGTKVRYATAVVLDPTNPTNNLWLKLADPNHFIRRAKETARFIRERM